MPRIKVAYKRNGDLEEKQDLVKVGDSIELVKRYEDNVLLGIKLNIDGTYLYVSTMYDVQESKVSRRLHSGRLKKFEVDNTHEK